MANRRLRKKDLILQLHTVSKAKTSPIASRNSAVPQVPLRIATRRKRMGRGETLLRRKVDLYERGDADSMVY